MLAIRQGAFNRVIVRIIFVMMLLPHVLAALPSSASAAEQALYADLMESRCLDMDGDGLPDKGPAPHNCNECCLAIAALKLEAPRLAVAEPLAFPVPLTELRVPMELSFAAPPSEAVFRPLSQRGPPAWS